MFFPIKILICDNAASQSFVVENILLFNDDSFTEENVLAMDFVNVPLHEIFLCSDLVTGGPTPISSNYAQCKYSLF